MTINDHERDDRARWLALYVLCAGVLMIVLDSTIVNVALPSIQDDLAFSQSDLAWVVNAYLIPFAGLLLLAGRVGDLIGHRRVFMIGLGVFTSASLLCATAQSREMLIAARFLQGIGGALASAVILGMIVTMFPAPRQQARAIGIYTFVAVAGGSIGLLAGGALTEAIGWHWVFFVNLPVGVATLLAARRLVDGPPAIGPKQGADLPGAALITAGLMLGVYAILESAEQGAGAMRILTMGGISVALLVLFAIRQARAADPLVPARLIRSRTVVGANVIQCLLVAGMFGMFFLGALYMQDLLGYGALEVGLAFMPWTLVMAVMTLRFASGIALRFGKRATLIVSLVIVAAAQVLFARAPLAASYVRDILPAMVLMGLGLSLAFPVLMGLAMSNVTERDSGLASGLFNTSMQVGGATGLAALASLAAEHTQRQLGAGEGAAEALNAGFHLAYLVGAGLVVIAIGVALTMLRPAGDGEQTVAAVREPASSTPAYSDAARPAPAIERSGGAVR